MCFISGVIHVLYAFFTTIHKETLNRHWVRVYSVKRCVWSFRFVFPEMDPSRYNKHIQKRHAVQPYREGVVVGKGKGLLGLQWKRCQ